MMNPQYFLGDDQDLDDRVIKKLWEENQELRDQVYQMKSYNPKNDEGNICICFICLLLVNIMISEQGEKGILFKAIIKITSPITSESSSIELNRK